jgi:hypothetical protein
MPAMPRLRSWRRLAFAAGLAWPAAAWAFLGVGDIVFDPENTAQTINVLQQAQQQFDRLGSLLGVSTRQFDQLVRLAAAMGDGGEAAPFFSPLTSNQSLDTLHSVPGLGGDNLDSLINANGLLDAFMGMSLGQWAQAFENPTSFYRTILVNPAIARIGASAGLDSPTVAYAQWYAARSPEEQYNLGPRAAVDFSNLLADDWLQKGRLRRVNLDGLAAGEHDTENMIGGAETMADAARVQARLAAGTNAVLLETAAQNADAGEASVRALHAQSQILQDQADAQRDVAEMRLDAPP